MKFKLLAALIAAVSSPALALQGKVLDIHGNPIPNADVFIDGESQTVKTDRDGEFNINSEGAHEIHVTAVGFSHKALHIDHENPEGPIVITLLRTVIEQVDVIGLPIHASAIESAQPIAVLNGEALRNQQAATLGDSLANEVGVHTSFHGNVASTPIIRGLSGPRVLITQNYLDVSDVSRVGPDHAVASEVSTAEQVEIFRGPATLFFGSGAIGGVVNVVDKRVPTETETYGEWQLAHETVNDQRSASFNLNTGLESFAFHLDGFWRESENYESPVAPELDHEDEGENIVANSAEESNGVTLGSSVLLDEYLPVGGYVGFSIGKLNREYGIPGHAHGEEEHEADEEAIYADLEQDRYQLMSELDLDSAWLSSINTRLGYTEYQHAEIEESEIGTTFSNKTTEMKVDFMQQPLAEWKGGLVLHYKKSEVAAAGEEAFTPPSESENLGLAIVQERHIGDVLLQLGARVERDSLTADNILLPQLEVHGHDEEDEEEHEDVESPAQVFARDLDFSPLSISFGAVWDYRPGYNLGLSLAHSQRAPSASEVFSFGPHIGTRSYDIGALFASHEEDGETHFELSEKSLELEKSNNIDITFRKHEGDLGFILNAFYNRVDNYYYQAATGLFAEVAHDDEDEHEEEEGAEDEHSDELPVYLFTSADAELYGLEAQVFWQLNSQLKATFFSDSIRAELKGNGMSLPRTPPLRYGARIVYDWDVISAQLSWTHYDDQTRVAELESATAGYDWLDASITWNLALTTSELQLFVKAENLGDTEARVHTSFLKDIAPRPGRNFRLGIRGTF